MPLIKSSKKNNQLPPQGTVVAEFQLVTPKNEGKNLSLGFKLEGFEELVSKSMPASLDKGPLRMDLETLNGGPFTDAEINVGIDPESFKGKHCRVVVIHQRASGGRLTAVVNAVISMPEEKMEVAATS